MIRRGEVYQAQVATDSQDEALVLVVSNNASNRSTLPTVTVLAIVSQEGEEVPGLEVAFTLGNRGVKVQPHSLTVVTKKDLEKTPVGMMENSLLGQVDTLLARHLALPAAGFKMPNTMDKSVKERGVL